ncbi:dihydroneopterin triphosphate diphosphatase [Thioalkalivibrio denitrificans]|uniref:Dihydroneopterin triphosphate diphosphatase n=1 Tax=Thioalkalivibrio denitrificans TaxID=108003 RepID=A0A1V3NKG2_9GAMM|nr:dihydroneopterin triphosphate diphosphatase [Thioalkalivibrio denitrificans]OOG25607.1 dihydroneopterin triphosphate diphosphatase [Thioalkalivibrio denitrificans]
MSFKRPESVLVVVHTLDGQVLLLRRREPPDFWQSVTGSLEWDETPEAAARRELMEETGLEADGLVDCRLQYRFPIHTVWRHRYAPDVHENLEHVYLLPLPDVVAVRIAPEEHSEYRWLPAAEAAERCFSWTNARVIRERVPGGSAIDA